MTMQRTPEQNYQVLFIIWAVLLFSQVTLLLVIYLTKPELFKLDLSQPLLGPNPAIVGMFFLLAPFNLGLSFLLKKRAYQEALDKKSFAYAQTGMVIGCALCETVSLLGVVLAFMIGYRYFFVFLALGFAGILLHFPRRQDAYNMSFK